MTIVDERPDLEAGIRSVICEAFGQDAEARLVDNMRQGGDLAVSLATVCADEVCGHIALSRLRSPADALALAPLAVAPRRQRRGLGSRLVHAALERARARGVKIVFVLGDPNYYRRFGFSAATASDFPSAYAGPHFMALRLGGRVIPPAPVVYAEAFDRLA